MSAAQDEFNELMRDKERRHGHPEDDNDDGRSFLNISDDEDNAPSASRGHIDPDAEAPRPSTSSFRSTIPTRRYGANTGVKGVISDAQDFRDARRTQRMSLQNSTNLSSQTYSPSPDGRAPIEKLEEEGEDDLEEDGDFMHKWRQGRLREMQTGTRDSKMHLGSGINRRLYGGLATVDGEGYLDAVDNSGPATVVIVYIYDDYVSTQIPVI